MKKYSTFHSESSKIRVSHNRDAPDLSTASTCFISLLTLSLLSLSGDQYSTDKSPSTQCYWPCPEQGTGQCRLQRALPTQTVLLLPFCSPARVAPFAPGTSAQQQQLKRQDCSGVITDTDHSFRSLESSQLYGPPRNVKMAFNGVKLQ